jgi:3-oxoadipate enol-lactonase
MNRERRGEREYEALIGIPAAEALADVHAMSPEMYEAVIAGAFGGALADANLERAAREVATVAILGGHNLRWRPPAASTVPTSTACSSASA